MSGGSMDYCYCRVDEAAKETDNAIIRELLEDAARLLHDEEWWRSSDYGRTTYETMLKLFTKKWLRKGWRKKMEEYYEQSGRKPKAD